MTKMDTMKLLYIYHEALQKIASYHQCERNEMTNDDTYICPHCVALKALASTIIISTEHPLNEQEQEHHEEEN